MMRRTIAGAVTISFLAASGAVSAADTLESVEKKIAEKWAKYRTVQYKAKSTTDIQTDQLKQKSAGEMTVELARKGKGWQMRMETTSSTTRQLKDQEPQKSKGKTLMIYDGQFNYMLNDSDGQKSAMKMKPDPTSMMNLFDMAAVFKQGRKLHEVKLLPDEKVGGKAVYVMQMTPKKASPGAGGFKTVTYYDQKTGVSMKVVTYDDKGKETAVSTTTNIKIDPKINPDRFVFKVPDGVQLVDMTKSQGDDAAASGGDGKDSTREKAESEEPAQKKQEAKQEEKKEAKKETKKKMGLKGLFNKLK